MRTVLLLIFLLTLLSYCKTPKSTNTGSGTASKRWHNMPSGSDAALDQTDTIIVTGSEYIPVLGRNETGMKKELEGTWVLQTLNGVAIKGTSNVNIPVQNLPPGTELKRDSVTRTELVNGVPQTTTEVNIDRIAEPSRRITPPQGPTLHIPARPSLNFYGLNETFAGFTGCNKITGRYSIHAPDVISLQNSNPSTKMVCIGDYDENEFLSNLKKVNKYKSSGDKLELLSGDQVVMVFSRK